MEYSPTIGLEIHAELKTNTKLFCNSKNDSNEKKPNVNICPVCMGHPGTLPVLNRQAIKNVLTIGFALGSDLADFTEFDRKNYFYPDIPKGYQISQYKFPLVSGGKLNGIVITRIHLEEDTARSVHSSDDSHSLIDFNRAGVPLMELVTEPMIKDAKQAVSFARELQLLIRYLGIGDANMEKGEMRVEANVSISSDDLYGTKVEVKNLNSFKAVERAIQYEIQRQTELVRKGGRVVQETRGWDENKQSTYTQRIKEESHDYRYFPDPDLLKLKVSEIFSFIQKTKELHDINRDITKLPEMPWEKRYRYKKDFGIKDEDIEVLIQNMKLNSLFNDVALILKNDRNLVFLATNYITSDIVGLMGGEHSTGGMIDNISPENLADLMKMFSKGEVSSRGVKNILLSMFKTGDSPKEIAQKAGLFQKSDEIELKALVDKIITGNEKAVQEYQKGKESALQFLIGEGMKESKGSANPKVLHDLFKAILS